MTSKKQRNADLAAADKAEAVAELKKLLKPGATVYTVLKHCSSSGMMRVIDLVIPYTRIDTVAERPRLRLGLAAPRRRDHPRRPQRLA